MKHEVWVPSTGKWNSKFSEIDKSYCINLYFYFKEVKKFNDTLSENMALMLTYKNMSPYLTYSKEQEAFLQASLQPTF